MEQDSMEDNLAKEKHAQEIRKSQVRVWVTYIMTCTYAVAAVILVGRLMWQDKTDLAIAVFSGVASTSASIIAFWFGSRGSARTLTGSALPSDRLVP